MGPGRLPKEGETWAGPWRMTHRADECSQPRPALSHSHKAGRAWGWWMKKKNWSRQGRERRPEGSAEGP